MAPGRPFFHAACRRGRDGKSSVTPDPDEVLTLSAFESYKKGLPNDPAAALVHIIGGGGVAGGVGAAASQRIAAVAGGSDQVYFSAADLKAVVEGILQTHEGLEFLADAPEFGPRYVCACHHTATPPHRTASCASVS